MKEPELGSWGRGDRDPCFPFLSVAAGGPEAQQRPESSAPGWSGRQKDSLCLCPQRGDPTVLAGDTQGAWASRGSELCALSSPSPVRALRVTRDTSGPDRVPDFKSAFF